MIQATCGPATRPASPSLCVASRLPSTVQRVCALVLSISIALTGCGTQILTTADVTHAPRYEGAPTVFTTVPRVVADKHLIDLAGFEITPTDRARLNNPRSTPSYRGPLHSVGERPGEAVAHCLIRGLIVFCPILMVTTLALMGTAHAAGAALHAAKNAAAPADTPIYIPAEGDGVRLAALFSAHTGSETLRQGVSLRILQRTDDQREFPRLMVWVESARLDPGYGGATFVVTARSQGFLASDVKGTEVVHQITSPRRKVDEWLGSNGKLFREDLDGAFDALSTSIVSVYMLEKLKDPTGGVPAQ